MRLRNFLIVFVVISAALLVGGIYASVTSAPPERVTPTATVSVLDGEAFLLRGGSGQWVAVGAPTALSAGDRVRTGENSSASLVFFDQSSARLDASTEIEIEALQIDSDNLTRQRVDVAVVAGRVWSRIIKFVEADSSYRAETSTLVATVRGTAFVVDARDAGNHLVWVADGRVGVSLVRPPDVPGGRRTLGPPTEIGEGEEARREKGTIFAVSADRLRVRKLSDDADRRAYVAGELIKDQKFLEASRQAAERILGRYAPGALPGSATYPLKRLGERLRLALTTDPEARRELRLAYADRRFAEAVILAMARRREAAAGAFRSYYRRLAEELKQIDPPSSTVAREQAAARFKKINGRLREHKDLIYRLGLDEETDRFVLGAASDPRLSSLDIPGMISRIEEENPLPATPVDVPLYVPQNIEAAPATPTPETPMPSSSAPPANINTNTNSPTNTNQPVAATPVSLAVVGERTFMFIPDSQQFRAVVTFSDNSTQDVTDLAAWSLEGGAIGAVASGLVTTSSSGTAMVVAIYQSLRGSFSVIVPPPAAPTLSRVTVSCPSPTLRIGLGEQCAATAVYSDESTKDVTSAAVWSVADPSVGRVSSTGYFTAATMPGSTSVTAGYTDGATVLGSFNITTTPY